MSKDIVGILYDARNIVNQFTNDTQLAQNITEAIAELKQSPMKRITDMYEHLDADTLEQIGHSARMLSTQKKNDESKILAKRYQGEFNREFVLELAKATKKIFDLTNGDTLNVAHVSHHGTHNVFKDYVIVLSEHGASQKLRVGIERRNGYLPNGTEFELSDDQFKQLELAITTQLGVKCIDRWNFKMHGISMIFDVQVSEFFIRCRRYDSQHQLDEQLQKELDKVV